MVVMTFLDVCVIYSADLPWMIFISLTDRRRKEKLRTVGGVEGVGGSSPFTLHFSGVKSKDKRRRLTVVDVGAERQGAVLYVEGERVDVEVTGADHPEWKGIVQHPVVVQVQVRDYGGRVFIHAVNQSR